MDVVGYRRVSTDEQSKEGVSLEAQAWKIQSYCELYGLNLVTSFEDAGVSAKTLEREGLQAALKALRDRQAMGLVVSKIDRLTRSVSDLSTLLTDYFNARTEMQLFSVADQIDTRSASGRLVLNVLTTVSQWERETIVERTQDALDHKRSKGERIGTIPYGFELDPLSPRNEKGKLCKLQESPKEQRLIELMRDLRGASPPASFRMIAFLFNESGFPTRSGRPWCHTTIAAILKRAEAS